MKNLKTLLLIAVLTLSVGGVANAQKIGHVDLQRVIANMPETRALQDELVKLRKSYKDDMDGLAKKYEAKIKKYQAEAPTQTKQTNEKRGQELQSEQLRMQQTEKGAVEDMQNRYATKMQPIVKKAQDAIKEIAKTKGLTYVLDASQNGGVLVANGVDIYNDLKTKLGLLKNLPEPKPQAQK
ncbi:OmpH family outer membrane protein [Polaribacter sp. MSW13]|uniref:OmpH family outer membrane protein n=1 Tax=Polaribacter marinus TaxID=2916838 RepID=A0A9X2AL92_9FLAO|nr:OmpH family outer membrane protein [Polaribacter marinus]MCI2229020.1 OmpH family outer membrane protein [Polaribacter marinus]